MNSPWQWTRQVTGPFGGTRNPLIISWPAKKLPFAFTGKIESARGELK
jgi:hypothetical protein